VSFGGGVIVKFTALIKFLCIFAGKHI